MSAEPSSIAAVVGKSIIGCGHVVLDRGRSSLKVQQAQALDFGLGFGLGAQLLPEEIDNALEEVRVVHPIVRVRALHHKHLLFACDRSVKLHKLFKLHDIVVIPGDEETGGLHRARAVNRVHLVDIEGGLFLHGAPNDAQKSLYDEARDVRVVGYDVLYDVPQAPEGRVKHQRIRVHSFAG